mmetsp:Transcript_32209/g.88377  ORF Transcript_32209/g.88377 Transcript_32209/m.88377 type:complete len:102 (-) Transcript_32209:23-328(-)
MRTIGSPNSRDEGGPSLLILTPWPRRRPQGVHAPSGDSGGSSKAGSNMPAAFVLRGESRAETEGWLEDLSQVAGHRGPACDRWYRKWLESVGRASDRFAVQ